MKKTITINLDFTLVERLKGEENYSALINELLNNHYSMKALNESTENLTKEQLIELIAITEKKAEIKKQLEELEREYNGKVGMA